MDKDRSNIGLIFVSPALLTVGDTIGTILPLQLAAMVSVIDGLTFSSIMCLHGGAGSREHMGFLKLMEASLGKKGSRLLAASLITVTQVGWFFCTHHPRRRGHIATHAFWNPSLHNHIWSFGGWGNIL